MRRVGAECEGSVNDDDVVHDSIPSMFFSNKTIYVNFSNKSNLNFNLKLINNQTKLFNKLQLIQKWFLVANFV